MRVPNVILFKMGKWEKASKSNLGIEGALRISSEAFLSKLRENVIE